MKKGNMKNFKFQRVTRLLLVCGCLVAAGASRGAEFWLRTGTTTKTMPDGRSVVMWGFAQDSSGTVQDGVITVPGPQLNVAAGDALVIHLKNTLPEPASIIIPGQYNYDSLDPAFHSGDAYDGRVRSLTREAAPGGTATYTWSSVSAGTFLYHSGSHPSISVQMGLYGALSVVSSGPQLFAGVPFTSSVTLLFSEIDPEVHDAVAAGQFGPGPGFMAADFSNAAALISQIASSSDAFAQFVAASLTSGTTADALVADLNALITGPSIYDPNLLPDSVLSPAVISILQGDPPPSLNYPTSGNPFSGNLVRMNRLLLQDGLANAGITLPPVRTMTSTIRSYPQYFLVNGQPYTNGIPAIAAGSANSTIKVSLLNAGMDAHVPTLNNGGDLQLVGEDGQQAPYPRSTTAVWMPALKTVDALWAPSAAGTYAIYDRRLGVVNGTQSPGGMVALLSVASAVAVPPLTIIIPPASETVPEFTTATFRVVAGGTNLTYQWQRNGVNIAGATGSAYSLGNASRTTDNGAQFRVVVSGTGSPAITSSSATLTVTAAAPTIVTQPASHNVTPPTATSFTVSATGSTPLTYQWQKGASSAGPFTSLANGIHISGATGTTLNLLNPTAPADAGFYQVIVTGPGGTVTSIPAELRVAPAIATQPASVTVPDLTVAAFTVVATGSSLTYQWQTRNGGNGQFASITGATNSTYSFLVHYLADNGDQYRVIVSGSGGPNVTSGNATLTVTPHNSAPTIATQPISQSVNSGSSVSFTVGAYGYPAPSYQWQRYNGATWGNVANSGGFSGATTATLSINNPTVAHAGTYRVTVSNSVGSVTSSSATLTVTQGFLGIGALIPASGAAIPYPARSANVPAFTGAQVQNVTVDLLSLTHPEPYDLSALLVTPGNAATARKVEFMAGLGVFPAPFEGGVHSYGVTNVNLSFSEAAASQVSTLYPLSSGTYQSTVTEPVAAFPGSAPGLPYATSLTSFNGYVQTSSSGWSLYVQGTPGDIPITTGGLLVAWRLNLTVGPGAAPAALAIH